MAKIIQTWRDPYDMGFNTTKPSKITIEPGVTILVGCNGAGKTTLMHNIKDQLRKEKTSYMEFNNLIDGNHTAMDFATRRGDIAMTATMMTSSEGENILHSLTPIICQSAKFIKTGKSSLAKNELFESNIPTNERWFFFDAIDSGCSIDNIIELKRLFELMKETAKENDVDLYIIVSANSYEMAHDMNCFDIIAGKYISFTDYNDYKQFILNTRKKKDKRYEK